MAQSVTTIAPSHVSIPGPDPASEHVLRRCMSGAHSIPGGMALLHPPTVEQRQLLAGRQKELIASLRNDRRTIGQAVTAMLLGYPHAIKANETAEQVVAFYVAELCLDPPIPTWAAILACNRIRMGNSELQEKYDIGRIHRPSTSALRNLCNDIAWKVRAELGNIMLVLNGKPYSPDVTPAQRERIAKGWDSLAEELKSRNRIPKVDRTSEIELGLRALAGDDAFDAIPDASPRRGGAKRLGEAVNSLMGQD